MKIGNLSLLLTSTDILSLIKKFSLYNSLYINSISITDRLTVIGKVSLKSINIPFNCKLSIDSFNNESLSIKIDSFTAINISIPTKIKEAALKKILSSFSKEWLSEEKGIIKVNIIDLIKHNNISTLSVKEIAFIPNHISIVLENISLIDDLETLLSFVKVQDNHSLIISI